MNTHHHHHTTLKSNRRNRVLAWVTGILAVATIIAGAYYFYSFNTATYSDDAQVQQLLSPVNARVGGYIKEVNFAEFQPVKKGDTLIVIDNTDYLVQKELAEANLMDATAGKNVTKSSVTTVENTVNVASSNIEELKARLWSAEKNFQRYQTLLQQESVTEQQFDQVKSEYEALKAKLNALRER